MGEEEQLERARRSKARRSKKERETVCGCVVMEILSEEGKGQEHDAREGCKRPRRCAPRKMTRILHLFEVQTVQEFCHFLCFFVLFSFPKARWKGRVLKTLHSQRRDISSGDFECCHSTSSTPLKA